MIYRENEKCKNVEVLDVIYSFSPRHFTFLIRRRVKQTEKRKKVWRARHDCSFCICSFRKI